jgi:hypothetical protein
MFAVKSCLEPTLLFSLSSELRLQIQVPATSTGIEQFVTAGFRHCRDTAGNNIISYKLVPPITYGVVPEQRFLLQHLEIYLILVDQSSLVCIIFSVFTALRTNVSTRDDFHKSNGTPK